jgi:hypothetical protein
MNGRDKVWFLEKDDWSQEVARLLKLVGYRVEFIGPDQVEVIQQGAVLVPDSHLDLLTRLTKNRKNVFPFIVSDRDDVVDAGFTPVIRRGQHADAVCAFIDHRLFAAMRDSMRFMAKIDAVLEVSGRSVKGYTINLSGGGALLMMPRAKIISGNLLALCLHDTICQRKFTCRVAVRWVTDRRTMLRRKTHVGVQFMVAPDQREQLSDFLREVEHRTMNYGVLPHSDSEWADVSSISWTSIGRT